MWGSLLRLGAAKLANVGRASGGAAAMCQATGHVATTFARALAAKANAPVPLAKISDNFLDATSMNFLEDLHDRWLADPASVDPSWRAVFDSLDSGKLGEAYGYSMVASSGLVQSSSIPAAAGFDALSAENIQKSMRLLLLVRAYQVNGHFVANLDPLKLQDRERPVVLDPALYGFSEEDYDKEYFIGQWNMKGFLNEGRHMQTLRQIRTRLEETYCGNIGFEYMHIPDRDLCNWLRERIETPRKKVYSPEQKQMILDRLMWSEMFESFLAKKWPAGKRFGLEGGEVLIPGMKALIDRSSDLGVEAIVMGMPHRGRLNVLGEVVRMPLASIFGEFEKKKKERTEEWEGSGDVKYHLGTSYDRPTVSGNRIHLSLVANPSHLEAVNPVVEGKVRAKQYYRKDGTKDKNMALLIHGDGAFSGQGVVYETMHMSELPGYSTGGTIHIVLNNQVAFTTDPKFSRSSPYCTDVAKAVNVPIFHVNGDDPEAVCFVCELAAEWRQAHKKDVVIDVVCYRRHGHNEIDEPLFTQPMMYQAVRNQRTVLTQYEDRLIAEGVVTKERAQLMRNRITDILEQEYAASKTLDAEKVKADWLKGSQWGGLKNPMQVGIIRNTGVPQDVLKQVGMAFTEIPEEFSPHRGVKRVYEARRKMITSGEGIDWATAEALAFATLLVEGNHVRLSGQDVERGTFSHRHALLHDQHTGERYIPLDSLFEGQDPNQFSVSNSSLSEFGIMGFELGYSMENPKSLVLWEAQFGDFANGAQVIIDQFLSSGESKWLRQSGLVLLLPHGYDGQGPEHSSARLERYLQMSDDDPTVIPEMDHSQRTQIQKSNWQVCNVTTPANYFHLLRRQIHREFRKPLIVMSPKELLRHPRAKSKLIEFNDQDLKENEAQGTRFKRLIYDREYGESVMPEVDRVVFCSGKIYYDLLQYREENSLEKKIALARVEQISPFPFDLACREMKRYPNAQVTWCQEEPLNMGAFTYVAPRLSTCMKEVGRSVEELAQV
eukprot:scaffold998_cov411-Prasinococcus_capsulatus_cf.AAC.24